MQFLTYVTIRAVPCCHLNFVVYAGCLAHTKTKETTPNFVPRVLSHPSLRSEVETTPWLSGLLKVTSSPGSLTYPSRSVATACERTHSGNEAGLQVVKNKLKKV